MRQQTEIKKILVVEDDQSIAEVICGVLTEMPLCEVMLASSPAEALKLVEASTPSVCLLDYNLPHMNGIELYDHICTIEGMENIPALIMSANLPQQAIRRRKLAAISKPFDLDTLLQILERLLAGEMGTSA